MNRFTRLSKKNPVGLLLLSLLSLLLTLPTKGDAPTDFTVQGTIRGPEGPLVGVTIMEKGTTNGTTSGESGYFILTTNSPDAILVFSFIGYEDREVSLAGQSRIDVQLTPSSKQLSGVVVTALGIKRSERSLGYAVGSVSGDEMREVPHENLLSALAGKVPGVQVNSTGDPGSTISVIIRGQTSLNGDNQPLYVVDGVPMSSTSNNVMEAGDRNQVDYGNVVADIDPSNIESISILKGPNASALYGSRAAHGVVLITTKNGSSSNGLGVSVTSSTVFDLPYKHFPLTSSLFAPGTRPYTPTNHPANQYNALLIDEGETNWVGPELDKGYEAIQWNSPLDDNGNPLPIPLVSYPDNWKHFFQTGITSTNNVAVSNNKNGTAYRLSYTNMANRGLIPETDLHRHNFQGVTSFHLTDNLEITADVNYAKSLSGNRPAGSRGTNPISILANLNPSINILDLKEYWQPGQEGIQQRSFDEGQDNPWFLLHEVKNGYERNHFWGNIRADWSITPHIDLMVRYSMDNTSENRETKISKSYTRLRNGYYGLWRLTHFERNADFLATYTNRFGDFDLSASLGGNLLYDKNTSFHNTSADGGLVLPELFNLINVDNVTLDKANAWSQRAMRSAYALASLGYKDMIYLDISGRNDWSSTLPPENRSYFYPSVSLSALLDQILNMPAYVNMFKIRGGIAQAGKDAGPYELYPVLGNAANFGGGSSLSIPNTLLNAQLKPEIKSSKEFGTDLAFANNRIRFSFTYYQSDNKNQILSVDLPFSTGYGSRKINAGLVRSKGVEFNLGVTPTAPSSSFQWDINLNLSRNRTKIVELTADMEAQHQPFILWEEAQGGAWTYVGGTMGDMYDQKLIRVTDENSPYYQWPLLSEDGSWNTYGGDPKDEEIVGNFNPKFTMGMQTTLTFKGFSLSASIDWRNGGDYYSQTYRYTESDLHGKRYLEKTFHYKGAKTDLPEYLKAHAEQRIIGGGIYHAVGGPTEALGGFEHTEGGITLHDGVFNPGVIPIRDQAGNITGYQENLGGPGTQYIRYGDNYPWDFSRAALFPASFIKLREISLSYDLPAGFVQRLHLQRATLAVFSRNIMLWTKAKNGLDPEHAYQPNGGKLEHGVEMYNASPLVLPIGIKLSVDF